MNRDISKALALFSQIAISIIVPILICLFIGNKLDKVFGLNGIFLIIFIIIGILAGFRSVYVLVKGFYEGKDSYIDMNKIKGDLQKDLKSCNDKEDKDDKRNDKNKK